MANEPGSKSLLKVRDTFTRLSAVRQLRQQDLAGVTRDLQETEKFLAIADRVSDALEVLSDQLFRETLDLIEEKLSIALQDILEQPIRLIADASWKHQSAVVDFYVDREGNREDILRGQGGSVANILSIGLRMFAVTALESSRHRKFLVFDEQDCWLRPDLVPRLVKIVRDASHALGLQVLMISHHDREIFEAYADRIYQLRPDPRGVAEVELVFDRQADEPESRGLLTRKTPQS